MIPDHLSRRGHVTDASFRGNQLVSRRCLGIPKALVTVWFLIRLLSSTTLLRVRASKHVEPNQFRPFVGLHQVSSLWDNNVFNIINIRPTVITINKIHIQPIFFSFGYVFEHLDSNCMRDWFEACGNATVLPWSPAHLQLLPSIIWLRTLIIIQVHLEHRQTMALAQRDT